MYDTLDVLLDHVHLKEELRAPLKQYFDSMFTALHAAGSRIDSYYDKKMHPYVLQDLPMKITRKVDMRFDDTDISYMVEFIYVPPAIQLGLDAGDNFRAIVDQYSYEQGIFMLPVYAGMRSDDIHGALEKRLSAKRAAEEIVKQII